MRFFTITFRLFVLICSITAVAHTIFVTLAFFWSLLRQTRPLEP